MIKGHGFTDEELDYIINYDIKYRMGQDLSDSDEWYVWHCMTMFDKHFYYEYIKYRKEYMFSPFDQPEGLGRGF